VLDSSFANLKILAEDLVVQYFSSLPKFLIPIALQFVKRTIKKEAKFSLNDIDPLSYAQSSFISALFISAKHDTFILPKHTQMLHNAYGGDKILKQIEGNHQSDRDE